MQMIRHPCRFPKKIIPNCIQLQKIKIKIKPLIDTVPASSKFYWNASSVSLSRISQIISTYKWIRIVARLVSEFRQCFAISRSHRRTQKLGNLVIPHFNHNQLKNIDLKKRRQFPSKHCSLIGIHDIQNIFCVIIRIN